MLSTVLATVATNGTLTAGVTLLLVYALGFAVPMLVDVNGRHNAARHGLGSRIEMASAASPQRTCSGTDANETIIVPG